MSNEQGPSIPASALTASTQGQPFHSASTWGRRQSSSGGGHCPELRSPPQTGASTSGMWRLTGLLLFVATWGISSTPAPLGKATPPLPQDPCGLYKALVGICPGLHGFHHLSEPWVR